MKADSADSLRLGVIQLNSGSDRDQNLQRCEELIAEGAQKGARLLVLPENFAFFGAEEDKHQLAESLESGGRILDFLSNAARKNGVSLVAGGMPERSADEGRPYNTSVAFDSSGQVVGSYRKIHLFDVDLPDGRKMRESAGSSAGRGVSVVELEGFRVGLTICYDLRFGELFSELRRHGAEILTVPAAFTEQTGSAHWHILLRARAVEFQCWVAAAGQWGTHPLERRTYGHSMVVDPWGVTLTEHGEGPGVAVTDIHRSYLSTVRTRLPSWEHRVPLG